MKKRTVPLSSQGGRGGSEIFLSTRTRRECSRNIWRIFAASVRGKIYNASSLLQLRISLGLYNEPSKPHSPGQISKMGMTQQGRFGSPALMEYTVLPSLKWAAQM